MLLFGLEEVMKDLMAACAGLDIECKKFPDLKSWQDIYGTWRSQCHEYKRFLLSNAAEICSDVSVVFTAALQKDWGTCSQDAKLALEQVKKSVASLKAVSDEQPPGNISSVREISDLSKLVDHIRIACKHGLHRCDDSGLEWAQLVNDTLKTTVSEAWHPETQAEPTGGARQRSQYASLTSFLRAGMEMTEKIATTTITGRNEPRWFCTHINDSYLASDFAHLIRAIDALRGGSIHRGTCAQLPPRNVGLYVSTMGGMKEERRLLSRIVLPAVARCLIRAGIHLSWIDLRSAGPEKEFTKNCITDAVDAMDACRVGQNKLFAMFLLAGSEMLSDAEVYTREKLVVKKFASSNKTELDKSTVFMAKLQIHLQARFASIFEAWTFFDLNGDWNVSTVEFVLEYKKLKMPIPAKDVLKVIDKDGYGDIDVHEFVDALSWHELPGDGSKEAIDKTVAHYALRRKTVLKQIHERLAEFHAVQNGDDELLQSLQEQKDSPKNSQKATSPALSSPGLSQRNAVDHSGEQLKKNRVTTTSSRISKKSNKSSATVPMSQEIVQDSVLGPEILAEAAKEQRLDWLAHHRFMNSRLQRIELEHAMVQNRQCCEAIVFKRALPGDTTEVSTQATTIDSAERGPLAFLGKELQSELEETGTLQEYCLQNMGGDMGSFAVRAAFAVIDAITANQASDEQARASASEEQDAVRRSADDYLWQEERALQTASIAALQESVLLGESKLKYAADIWKQDLNDACVFEEDLPGEVTQQGCIAQLVQWATSDQVSEQLNAKTYSDCSGEGPALQVGIMVAAAGSGLSSTFAMLMKSLHCSAEAQGGKISVLHYLKRPDHVNKLGPDTYLLSEIRGRAPFESQETMPVGLHQLAGALVQAIREVNKTYIVAIDGLSIPELSMLLSGCNRLKLARGSKATATLKLLVTATDTQACDPQHSRGLPQALEDVASNVEGLRVMPVRLQLNERQRCSLLHHRLGSIADTLSAPKALAACRLRDAALPEFLCVAGAYLKEVERLLPLDDAVLSLERTLESLYEFNIIPWLEAIHGPQLMQSAAEVLLQAQACDVSMSHFAALLARRTTPRVLDAETSTNLARRLHLYCNYGPHQGPALSTQGLILHSCTFRQVLARRYRMTHHLDAHEAAPRQKYEERENSHGHGAAKSKTLRSSTMSTQETDGDDDVALSAEMARGQEIKECDMDAVRSAMQSLVIQRLHEQVHIRKTSKAVPPTPKAATHTDELAPEWEDSAIEEKGEDTSESPAVESSTSDASDGHDQDGNLELLSPCKPDAVPAPILDVGLCSEEYTGETQTMRQKMLLEPVVYTVEGARGMDKGTTYGFQPGQHDQGAAPSLSEVQAKAVLNDQGEPQEILSSLTHGANLKHRHIWQGCQASKLLPSLDELITAAENPDVNNPIPDLMLIKHRTQTQELKKERESLMGLWAGAKMDVLWKALSVCNMDVSCRLTQVPPGIYSACWHLKFSSAISDFPDIQCTLAPVERTACTGPPVHTTLTVEQQDAVKTDKWCVVVVCKQFYVGEACDLVAALECQGKWLSGLIVDAFALLPVPKDQGPLPD